MTSHKRDAKRLLVGLIGLLGLIGLASDGALAQEPTPGLSFSAGVRAWHTEWTTFGYYPAVPNVPNLAITQTSGPTKWVPLPTLSARYGNFFASVSGFPSTNFEFTDGSAGRRSESDLNLGYTVVPGLSATLGYKRIAQRGAIFRYEPAGPVLGVSGNAALAGPLSLYGAFGLGRLKTSNDPRDEVVKFEASYRLTEVGVAYALPGTALVKRWTLTAGHRIQVMRSKEAFVTAAGQRQDGIDTTQGFTLGALATF